MTAAVFLVFLFFFFEGSDCGSLAGGALLTLKFKFKWTMFQLNLRSD